jgi:hypothetical protein
MAFRVPTVVETNLERDVIYTIDKEPNVPPAALIRGDRIVLVSEPCPQKNRFEFLVISAANYREGRKLVLRKSAVDRLNLCRIGCKY